LGNFKSLGGIGAGLKALARVSGAASVEQLLAAPRAPLPALLCASDGNHGLAVAAAARQAGTRAHVYLPAHVPADRVARIAALGATILRIDGSYDDAVDAARAAAARGDGLLIADTTDDCDDPVVADVMAGYGVIADEIRDAIDAGQAPRPTHLFVQAGVGGLAAALADGLVAAMASPKRIVVVEPVAAACVGHALASARVESIAGDLSTAADMLSCGRASAPALRSLLRHGARGIAVGEAALAAAPEKLRQGGGPPTTPSGAAGFAGLLAVADAAERRSDHGLDGGSVVLVVATEGPVPGAHRDRSGDGTDA
jgi:diaminopropionate ammonia-lyase